MKWQGDYRTLLGRIHVAMLEAIEIMAGAGHFVAWLEYVKDVPAEPQDVDESSGSEEIDSRFAEIDRMMDQLRERMGISDSLPVVAPPTRRLSVVISGSESQDGSLAIRFHFRPPAELAWKYPRPDMSWKQVQQLEPNVSYLLNEQGVLEISQIQAERQSSYGNSERDIDAWLCLATCCGLRRLIEDKLLQSTCQVDIDCVEEGRKLDIRIWMSNHFEEYRGFFVSNTYDIKPYRPWGMSEKISAEEQDE
jgi:hypothetical protein